jgi:hypothetical protein
MMEAPRVSEGPRAAAWGFPNLDRPLTSMGFSHTDAVRVASTLQNGTIVVMPPNGIVRGGGSSSTSNRVGAATAPVVFFDEEFDADGNQLGGFFGPTTGEFDYATTANLNDTVSPVANSAAGSLTA